MILITGATGFVGTHLMKHLNAQLYLTKAINLRDANYYSELDADVSTIIHLAGKAHDLKKVTNPQEYYEANFELTKQVFDLFLLSDASVFIFMSSVKASADEVKDILTEENSPNPKTHYGISKLQAENYILNQQLPEGKRVYILRPCMIHGPGNQGNLNLLYTIIKKGFPWPLAAFENQRSFLSIDNLCFVIQELLNRNDIPSGIYNIADDKPLSTNQLIGLISKSQNKLPKTLAIPKKLIYLLAKIGDVLHLPLNSERLQKLTDSYLVSNYKIVKAIEKPFPISAEEGFKKTFQSFHNQ
jgi:nucleoside-diphosphate-sugar epimerase